MECFEQLCEPCDDDLLGFSRARTLKLLLKFIKDLLKVASLVPHGVEHELFESLVDLLDILIAVGVVGAGVCEDYLNDRRELLLEYGLNELLRGTLAKLEWLFNLSLL